MHCTATPYEFFEHTADIGIRVPVKNSARGRRRKGVAEEQPSAYKDVNDVVDVVHQAGLAKRVVRLRPLGGIKG